ncbi:MAG: YkgJ family cysteine cluster protein [Thermodesulfovibrionales bacterium]|nr:YkgJ family cysteine cluster protein [Thermodesulfovibrionales bacterium]
MKDPKTIITLSDRFVEDQKKYPWLKMLLSAYEVMDRGIELAIEKEKKNRNTNLACKKGCANCCRTHKDIPLYPLELIGIYWYVIEKTHGSLRETLKKQLESHQKPICPFLIINSCSIYPLRPIACRQFNVFRQECYEGEDPYHTRRQDLLTPIKELLDKVFYIMLPFYGIQGNKEKHQAIKNNFLNAHVQNLHTINWKALSKRMIHYDYQNL